MSEAAVAPAPAGRMAVKSALVWCVLLTLFFAGWIAYEQHQLTAGIPITVRPVPVDPRDLLRGQYLTLRYDFSSPGKDKIPQGKPGDVRWVILKPGADGQMVFASCSKDCPNTLTKPEVAIRGTLEENGRTLCFGIEKFFIPEGTETPSANDMLIQLRIAPDGSPRIEYVTVKGKRWP